MNYKFFTKLFVGLLVVVVLGIGSLFLIYLSQSRNNISRDNIPQKELKAQTSADKQKEIFEAFNMGDYNKAVQLIDSYLGDHPNDAQVLAAKATVLANKGSVLFDEKNYAQQAIEIANRALEINPQLSEAFYARGYAYEIQNKFTEAIADYEKSLKNSPKNTTYLTQMGHVYDLMGNTEKAKFYYEKALEEDPDFSKALINMGRFYHRQGNLEEAKKYYTKSLENTNNTIDKAGILYSLGMISLDNKDIQGGYDYMKQAVDMSPEYPQALIGRGWAGMLLITQPGSDLEKWEKMGLTFQTVFEDVEKGIDINPNQTLGYLTMARMYLRVPSLADKSIEYYDRALEVVNKDITIMTSDKNKVIKDVKKEKQETLDEIKNVNKFIKTEKITKISKQSFLAKINIIAVAEAAGVWSGNCWIGYRTERDVCFSKNSFNYWIDYLASVGHITSKVNDYYATCTNGSPIYLVACGSSNGSSFASKPTDDLCINGDATWTDESANDGEWNWDCGISESSAIKLHCGATKTAQCTGNLPAGATECANTQAGLSQDTAWSRVNSSAGCNGHCQYYFECGHGASGNVINPPNGVNGGAVWCKDDPNDTNDEVGLTTNTPWAEVNQCTATKCEYIMPPQCGVNTNNKVYNNQNVPVSSQLCSKGTASGFNSKPSMSPITGLWSWTCSQPLFPNNPANCQVYKKGKTAGAPSSGKFSTPQDACEFGTVNSIHLVGNSMKNNTIMWRCGTKAGVGSDGIFHEGSLTEDKLGDGNVVDNDNYIRSTEGSCSATWEYTCTQSPVDCTGHCGTIHVKAAVTKYTESCFGNSSPVSSTKSQYRSVMGKDCVDKTVTCPCGAGENKSQGSNTTFETN